MFDFLLFVAIMKLKGGVGNEQQLYSEGFKYTAERTADGGYAISSGNYITACFA